MVPNLVQSIVAAPIVEKFWRPVMLDGTANSHMAGSLGADKQFPTGAPCCAALTVLCQISTCLWADGGDRLDTHTALDLFLVPRRVRHPRCCL